MVQVHSAATLLHILYVCQATIVPSPSKPLVFIHIRLTTGRLNFRRSDKLGFYARRKKIFRIPTRNQHRSRPQWKQAPRANFTRLWRQDWSTRLTEGCTRTEQAAKQKPAANAGANIVNKAAVKRSGT